MMTQDLPDIIINMVMISIMIAMIRMMMMALMIKTMMAMMISKEALHQQPHSIVSYCYNFDIILMRKMMTITMRMVLTMMRMMILTFAS